MSRGRWTILAALVFSLVAAATFAPIWQAGPTVYAPTAYAEGDWGTVHRSDVLAEAWIVSRGAYTLIHRPLQFFEAEHCAPMARSLAYGPAMLTMSIVAIPAYVATHDPVLIYNGNVVLYSLISAAAMYLLISEWTGVAAAGIVAGLFYGFHRIRMQGIAFLMDWNLAWTALAILFAQRLFARGRWRDAVGLALVVALQVWESMYTLLAAIFVALPFVLWLLMRYRFRAVRLTQLVFVGVASALGAAMYFAPYLAVRAEFGAALQRSDAQQVFAAWIGYLPNAYFFLGWIPMGLMAVALLLGRKRTVEGLGGGDPRWALLAGGLLAALVAAGPYNSMLLQDVTGNPSVSAPNLYLLLAKVIPGLDTVRKVACLTSGVVLVTCILAGMGAAALIRLSNRWGTLVAGVLVLAAALDVTRPAILGLPASYAWSFHQISAEKKSLDFFRKLDAMGNKGPLIELPVDLGLGNYTIGEVRIFLSFYHRRRTSACMGSFEIPSRRAFIDLSNQMPDPDAVRAIRGMGFTTAIIRVPVAGFPLWLNFMKAAENPTTTGVRQLYNDGTIYAFTLEPLAEATAPPTATPPN